MADYTDRETHHFKDGSSLIDSCRCNIADPRERLAVCKLDRYQLEDRYLRLQGEVHVLKKLSNNQEDKIKRLATKLMRFGANPRACIASIQCTSDQDKLSLLETENSKLREKLTVLRNQLVNQKIFGRSPSRGRRPVVSNGGPITCRSESSRLKAPSCQCINARPGNDENDVQNYILKIQQMEEEKKEMLSHISDLQCQLTSYESGNRREKIAENVEYIRVWRQMRQQSEKLDAANEANEVLNKHIFHLKNLLEESCKNHKDVCHALELERMQVAQLDEDMSNVKKSHSDSRDKDQRISDLTNELKILQQHNKELLELSAKFSKVEQDNFECRRKLAEQLSEQQNLKVTLNKEIAYKDALKAANNDLLEKLHELQKNVDTLSVQQVVQNESKKKDQNKNVSKRHKKKVKVPIEHDEKSIITSSKNNEFQPEDEDECKRCCTSSCIKSSVCESQIRENMRLVDEKTQTDVLIDSAKSSDKDKVILPPNGNSLSREGMLKLLDKVQINSPIESQCGSRVRRVSLDSVKLQRQVSNLENLLFGDSTF